jgi:hypothetical protein
VAVSIKTWQELLNHWNYREDVEFTKGILCILIKKISNDTIIYDPDEKYRPFLLSECKRLFDEMIVKKNKELRL